MICLTHTHLGIINVSFTVSFTLIGVVGFRSVGIFVGLIPYYLLLTMASSLRHYVYNVAKYGLMFNTRVMVVWQHKICVFVLSSILIFSVTPSVAFWWPVLDSIGHNLYNPNTLNLYTYHTITGLTSMFTCRITINWIYVNTGGHFMVYKVQLWYCKAWYTPVTWRPIGHQTEAISW